MIHFPRPFLLLAAVFANLLFVSSSIAGKRYNPTDFQEDNDLEQSNELSWPEIVFPDGDTRGAAFRPGEIFRYRAQWGMFRKAGTMTIQTSIDSESTNDTLLVESVTESKGLIRALYPLKLKGVAQLDSINWRMMKNTVTGKARSDKTDTETTFDYASGLMVHDDRENPHKDVTRQIPYPAALDYASALLQPRAWDLENRVTQPLLVSSKGKFYYVEMEVLGKETIKTPAGKMDAYRIEPTKSYPQSKLFREGGKMVIWISADEKRIPLRFDVKTKVGLASLRLESYEVDGEAMLAQK